MYISAFNRIAPYLGLKDYKVYIPSQNFSLNKDYERFTLKLMYSFYHFLRCVSTREEIVVSFIINKTFHNTQIFVLLIFRLRVYAN